MAEDTFPLPGTHLTMTRAELLSASLLASDLARYTAEARHAGNDLRGSLLLETQHLVQKVGNALGLVFTHAARGSGERAMQAAEIAMREGHAKHYAHLARRAADADVLQRKLDEAKATIQALEHDARFTRDRGRRAARAEGRLMPRAKQRQERADAAPAVAQREAAE